MSPDDLKTYAHRGNAEGSMLDTDKLVTLELVPLVFTAQIDGANVSGSKNHTARHLSEVLSLPGLKERRDDMDRRIVEEAFVGGSKGLRHEGLQLFLVLRRTAHLTENLSEGRLGRLLGVRGPRLKGFGPVGAGKKAVPCFRGDDRVVVVREGTMDDAVAVELGDRFVAPLPEALLERVVCGRQTLTVADHAVPGLEILAFKSIQSLAVLWVEVVDKAVHYAEQGMHNA